MLLIHGWGRDHSYLARNGSSSECHGDQSGRASDAPRQEYSVGVFADDVAWLVICSISRNRGGNIAPDSYVGAVT
jgi:hypothetical protein